MNFNCYYSELRLLLEELCCDLCRFEHSLTDGVRPEDIRIDREVEMGRGDAYADIRVQPPGGQPYFVEVKYGYTNQTIISSLQRKYGQASGVAGAAPRIVLVVDRLGRANWDTLERSLTTALPRQAVLEIWDEEHLTKMFVRHFGVNIGALEADRLLDLRQAIDRAKGLHAFGETGAGTYEHDPLKAQLLWHLGFWRLRQLCECRQGKVREILPPGLYRNVAVVIADLCSFSSFVRDTPKGEVIRDSLTGFYSKARSQIINHGGFHYQFVGDEIIGFFGLPDDPEHAPEAAYEAARTLCSVGRSISNEWQRHIDRVQLSGGLRVGMALGDLHMLSLRPFSRTHIGFVGDSINVAARLMSHGAPDEVVVTNSFYQRLPTRIQTSFIEMEPVEAKNVGRIKAWKTSGIGR